MASTRRPALPVITANPNLTARLFPAPPHGPIEAATTNMLRAAGFSRLVHNNVLRQMLMQMLYKHLRHLLFLTMGNIQAPLTTCKIQPNYTDTSDLDSPLANRIPDTFSCITLPTCRTG